MTSWRRHARDRAVGCAVVGAALVLAGCAAPSSAVVAQPVARGEALYRANCQSCHSSAPSSSRRP